MMISCIQRRSWRLLIWLCWSDNDRKLCIPTKPLYANMPYVHDFLGRLWLISAHYLNFSNDDCRLSRSQPEMQSTYSEHCTDHACMHGWRPLILLYLHVTVWRKSLRSSKIDPCFSTCKTLLPGQTRLISMHALSQHVCGLLSTQSIPIYKMLDFFNTKSLTTHLN
jgi:hypothetical protein